MNENRKKLYANDVDETLLDLDAAMIDPALLTWETMAGRLSRIARFAGRKRFFSVASHVLLGYEVLKFIEEINPTSRFNDSNLRRAWLVHDGAEAWLGELPSPVKNFNCVGYLKLESIIYNALERKAAITLPRFDFDYSRFFEKLKIIDDLTLSLEKLWIQNVTSSTTSVQWLDTLGLEGSLLRYQFISFVSKRISALAAESPSFDTPARQLLNAIKEELDAHHRTQLAFHDEATIARMGNGASIGALSETQEINGSLASRQPRDSRGRFTRALGKGVC